MKNLVVVFTLITLLSCSRNRDEVSANDVDPNFVPSTLSVNFLSTNLANLACFYENNFVEMNVDSSIVKSITWNLMLNGTPVTVGQSKKQILEKAGSYRANLVLENNGETKDSIVNFDLKFCEVFVIVPNAFKPNGDGSYDYWAPITEGVESLTFTVSTRRDKKLYVSSSSDDAWDGKYNGDKMPSGTYRYYITGTYKNGYLFEKKGTFELIR